MVELRTKDGRVIGYYEIDEVVVDSNVGTETVTLKRWLPSTTDTETVVCPHDTDGDGDCAYCARQGGCLYTEAASAPSNYCKFCDVPCSCVPDRMCENCMRAQGELPIHPSAASAPNSPTDTKTVAMTQRGRLGQTTPENIAEFGGPTPTDTCACLRHEPSGVCQAKRCNCDCHVQDSTPSVPSSECPNAPDPSHAHAREGCGCDPTAWPRVWCDLHLAEAEAWKNGEFLRLVISVHWRHDD